MLVVQTLYPQLERMSKVEQVRFYATAYNCGYRSGVDQIHRCQKQREYHTELFITSQTPLYNYAEVAVEYYRGEK